MKKTMLNRLAMILGVLILGMGTFLLVTSCTQKNEPLKMVTLKQRHTYVYTSALETFSIDVLVNTKAHALLLEDGVRDVVIIAKDDTTRIPLTLSRIDYHGKQRYDGALMSYVTYHLRIAVRQEEGTINVKDAALKITDVHGEHITLPIGNFNYYFGLDAPSRINVIARHNLHDNDKFLPTSQGVVLELENLTEDVIELIGIGLNDLHATFDLSRIVEVDNYPDAHTSCETLFKTACDVTLDASRPDEPIVLSPFESKRIALPLALTDEYTILHRYPIVIKSAIGDDLVYDVFDDFPFIRTNPFEGVSSHHETVTLNED